MAQRYVEMDEARLVDLHDGLETLEMLDREAIHDLDLYLYGLTSSAAIVDAAKEAIADEAEINEADVQLSEVAVAIPISADVIYALSGSGLRMRKESFAYTGVAGEGIRTSMFAFSSYKPTAAFTDFSTMALALSDSWLDDFLKQYGNKQPAQIEQNVRRTEEATQPGVPAPAQAPPAPTVPAEIPGTPKTTSTLGGLKLADVLEEFLG